MKAYKFVTGDVADKVAAGSIRLTSADEIRKLEDDKGGFGDRSELANEATIAGGSEDVPGDHPAFVGSMIVVTAGVVSYPSMTIVGETIQTVQDALLYCCSLEDTPQLRARMLKDFGADTVFEIANIQEFGAILAEHPRLAFREFEYGAVTYTPVAKGASALELNPVDPFRKDTKFEWQKEYRLLWAGQVFQKTEVVNEPRLTPLLKRLT